jgi:hypothetical protein
MYGSATRANRLPPDIPGSTHAMNRHASHARRHAFIGAQRKLEAGGGLSRERKDSLTPEQDGAGER